MKPRHHDLWQLSELLEAEAEGRPFDRSQLDALLGLADGGIRQLFEAQRAALAPRV